MDKPESEEGEEDEEEDEDHWKDASPITPTCSPTKHPPKSSQLVKTVEVDVHEFQPTSPLEEKDVIIIDSSVTPPSKKLAMRYNQGLATGPEKATPKVKLKRESKVVELEDGEKVPEIATESSTTAGNGKRRATKRAESMEKQGSKETGRTEGIEKDARKKVLRKKEQDRRSSRRKLEEVEEPASEASRTEADDGHRRRREMEGGLVRSREERKSLKEQECIERVTEFLTKHSVLSYTEMIPGGERREERELDKEQRIARPFSFVELEQEAETPEESAMRSKGVRRSEEQVKTPSSVESERRVLPVSTRSTGEWLQAAVEESAKPSVTSPETEAPRETKRRSSMRKRPGAFSRESSKESLLDETKKEVRIQENVEEIYFEDTSEHVSASVLPEVQLVKARIITAEEAAANRVEEPTRIEIHSPPEVAVVPDSVRVKTGRVPSPEILDTSQLQLVSLAKSTSENTLIETGQRTSEENKVSERNIKTEILLDLSKVSEVGDEELETELDGEARDRKLSRTGSEGSKRSERGLRRTKSKEREGGFKIGSLAQPDEPELTILLEGTVAERGRRTVEDDRDSLVDFGVEKMIRR
ncbi:hypothetical protein K0M31_007212 [Melipona bicolor]|uniref:Uncharacterized protein n=1 Tax=Melipona bicolor TaxID=60889 RepID=A0AA40GBR6_9HYME|nr:hypothetical protein K0M31_007212 [Melipona bicolor]